MSAVSPASQGACGAALDMLEEVWIGRCTGAPGTTVSSAVCFHVQRLTGVLRSSYGLVLPTTLLPILPYQCCTKYSCLMPSLQQLHHVCPVPQEPSCHLGLHGKHICCLETISSADYNLC